MPIALSLMFPFAEAAGITLTGLGIAKATDVIMNYIQANPEKSKQILSTLSPLIGGLGSILTNKESKGVLSPEEEKIFKEAAKDSAARGPETIETTPEQQPRLTGKEKGQRIKDAIRRAREGKGNYSSPDAVGPAVDIRGSVIREVEDMGMASKKRKPVNPNPEEDKTEYGGPSLTEEFRQLGRDRGSSAEFRELARLAKKIREGKADGGRIGYAPGGLATPQDYANALQKVGAGTETQKKQSLSNYLGDYISTQGQKLGNAAVIPLQAAKGVLGIQGTPMTSSMQSTLQNIIQNQISKTGNLSGNINYNDYGVQTSSGSVFEGFGNRSITDPESALATTLGRASYSVDPGTGKINFTGGTEYDFTDDQFGGLGKFISKGGVFNTQPTQYKPNISISQNFLNKLPGAEIDRFKRAYDMSNYGRPSEEVNWTTTARPNYERLSNEYKTWNQGPFFSDPDVASKFEGMFGKPYGYGLANGGLATMFVEKR